VGRDAVIVGIGQSPFFTGGEVSEYACGAHAILAALADAGLHPGTVDGAVRFDTEAIWEFDLTAGLGVRRLDFYDAVPGGPGGAPALLRMAEMAIAQGRAEVVLAYHARNRVAKTLYGPGMVGDPTDVPGGVLSGGEQYQLPFGVTARAHEAALVTRRHMFEYGTTTAQLAAVALAMRHHAAPNPCALRRERLTAAAHAASPIVAAPLRALDCHEDSVGAGAVVLTTAERARDRRRPPVRVLASMQAVIPAARQQLCDWYRCERDATMRRAATRLFGIAGVTPGDVGVACFYDGFTPLVLLGLEDYGFCGPGESGPFVEAGGIAWPDGALPVNTNGGQLAEAHLDGINNLLEAVRQLRGEAVCQVRGAEIALVAGSALEPNGAVLLAR
jgi:acetyl-CoA acetyltransferase